MLYAVAAVAVALTWALWMPLHFRLRDRTPKTPGLVAKVIPTLSAAAFAGWACFARGETSAYPELIFAGLCVCALADWMLGVRFEVGGALFFFGHVLYVLAFSRYRVLSWWNLTLFAAAECGMLFFLSHYRGTAPNKIVGRGLLIYSLALSALLGFGLPLPFLQPGARSWLAAVGAALFVLSDLTLCHNTVRQKPDRWHFVSLGIYYMAQFALGFSALGPRP